MAAGTRRLRRSDRLQQSRDFQRVAQRGTRLASRHFVVLIAPSGSNGAAASDAPVRRLGVTASRKVGNAVIRNRVKRAIRDWFRSERERLEADVDVVVIARRPAATLTASEISGCLSELVSGARNAT